MENKVQYTVTLKDLLSNALTQAEKKAKSLDGTLGGLGKTAIAAFGAYEAFNFVKDSVAAFDEAAQASALLNNQLQNSGRTSVEFKKDLEELAGELMEKSRFDDDAIASGQAVLAGFKNLSDELVLRATPALVDAATAMGTDVKSAAQAVGMALESPADATRKLRSMNILLNDEQKKTIENLVKSGDKAKAQAVVLDLIANKYKGAGEAAATTGKGPLIVLQNKLGNVTEAFGGVVVSIVDVFMPAIKVVVDLLKGFTKFLTENEGAVKAFAVGVTIAAGAFGAWKVYTMRAAIATKIMSINMAQLNLLMRNNALGIVITAVAALGAALYYAWEKSETFRKGVYVMWNFVKTYVGMMMDYFSALGDIIIGALTLDIDRFKKGVVAVVDLAKSTGTKFANAYTTGLEEGTTSWAEDQKTAPATGLIPGLPGEDGKPTEPTEKPKTTVSEPKGAPTTKATTITITIDKLVESLSVNTTNIQESTSKIRELVATALTDALNDSQIIAGG